MLKTKHHIRACYSGGDQTQVEQDLCAESPIKTVAATLPVLFKPGQQAKAAAVASGLPTASSQLQSDFQANVNVFAQQARGQRLKLKQAAVKAEVELDRLKGLLQREQALQVLCPVFGFILVHTLSSDMVQHVPLSLHPRLQHFEAWEALFTRTSSSSKLIKVAHA